MVAGVCRRLGRVQPFVPPLLHEPLDQAEQQMPALPARLDRPEVGKMMFFRSEAFCPPFKLKVFLCLIKISLPRRGGGLPQSSIWSVRVSVDYYSAWSFMLALIQLHLHSALPMDCCWILLLPWDDFRKMKNTILLLIRFTFFVPQCYPLKRVPVTRSVCLHYKATYRAIAISLSLEGASL